MAAENTVDESTQVVGLVFNIQRFSVHDGPGIRTLVFMQGCPLACVWCCNPEGQKRYPQLRILDTKCAGGGTCLTPCVEACPEGAITQSEDGKPTTDWALCRSCGKCVEVCLYGARIMMGQEMTVDEALSEIEQDRSFYSRSGGGVTVGGGEPLMQPEFVCELLKRCKERFLHTALETCGHGSWESLKAVCDYVDLLYYDIKHMDPEKHRQLTGISNELILSNARRALFGEVNSEVIVRTEVIPGCNDSEDEIAAIAKFTADCGGTEMELLPYHRLGSAKYRQMGFDYELREAKPPSDDQMQQLKEVVKSYGLTEMGGIY